jgi:hypothetical protein
MRSLGGLRTLPEESKLKFTRRPINLCLPAYPPRRVRQIIVPSKLRDIRRRHSSSPDLEGFDPTPRDQASRIQQRSETKSNGLQVSSNFQVQK